MTFTVCDKNGEKLVTIDEALLDRQIAMEQEAREKGAKSNAEELEKARKKNHGAETQTGTYLIKQAIVPVVAGIEQFVADAYAGKPGPKHTAAVILKDIDYQLAAYLTMVNLVNGIAVVKSRALSTVATSVSKAIELELKMAAFDEQKPGLYRTVMRRLEEQGATNPHKAKVVTFTANKYNVNWEGWSANEKLHLGAALIDIALKATGIAELVTTSIGAGKMQATISPTERIVEWVRDRNSKLATLRPVLVPMIVPPRDWKGVVGGGYRSDAIMKAPIVKRATKDHMAALKTADLSTVQTGLNAIQRTRWAVNRQVLAVAKQLWDDNHPMPGLPTHYEEPLPPKPHDIETNEEALKVWKAAARAVYEVNIANSSKQTLVSQILQTADSLKDEAAIFFPHNLDFRGRAYCRISGLNPQGVDLAKGLLTFAEGKPLVDERGIGWLAIHGANCFGVDKVSHDARVAWVYENAEKIVACANDPLSYQWWHEADAPWPFLAFCFEWKGFAEEGTAFVSCLPIAMDGSCNGIQHYSAMLRDEVGGAAVNLMPAEKPQDIYGKVAEEAIRKLKLIAADSTHEKAWIADAWVRFGLTRKETKRQVMVLPYGGTQNSCRDYTRKAIDERIKAGQENPFGEELFNATTFLAAVIWDSIGDVVIAARDAMNWLREVAKVATEAGVPLVWTTPSGFAARQDYRETKERRIKTRLGDQLIYFTHTEATDKLDKNRQATGLPPNFVHSMDASAMMLTIEMAAHNGLDSFAMIHDSYGTLAADTDKLASCIRHAFVDMYSGDVLAGFRDQIIAQLPAEAAAAIPPLPMKGQLDLQLVLDSPFFFT